LRFSGYLLARHPPVKGVVEMKIVTPQRQTLFEFGFGAGGDATCHRFSKTFKSMDAPIDCRIVSSNATVGQWYEHAPFDSLSLVSP
jgi:hypothetical protein